MYVQSLHTYPVKSFGGTSASMVEVTPTGFAFDRQWMVVEAQSHIFVSQRKDPALARFTAYVKAGNLIIRYDDATVVQNPLNSSSCTTFPVQVHSTWQLGVDQGDHVAKILSEIIGRPVRLVKKAPIFDRSSLERTGLIEVAFADGFPILLTSVDSLNELNSRLETPIPMSRFRPNIVLADLGVAFVEDFFGDFRLGDVKMQGRTRCTRCAITTTDQTTGARSAEPLRTLMSYRVFSGSKHPCFGLNVDHLETGWVHVGDTLEITEHDIRMKHREIA